MNIINTQLSDLNEFKNYLHSHQPMRLYYTKVLREEDWLYTGQSITFILLTDDGEHEI